MKEPDADVVKSPAAEGRIRRFDIPYRYLQEMIARCETDWSSQYIRAAKFDLPPDAHVIAVHNDWSRSSFAALLASKHFEPIPDGIEAPQIDVDWRYVELATTATEDK